jgi:hypothetical protein
VLPNMANAANQQLAPGTRVVHIEDGERGAIDSICMHAEQGINGGSWWVRTAHGQEVWRAGELFVSTVHMENRAVPRPPHA